MALRANSHFIIVWLLALRANSHFIIVWLLTLRANRNFVKLKNVDSPHIIPFGENDKLKELSIGIEELENLKHTSLEQKEAKEKVHKTYSHDW